MLKRPFPTERGSRRGRGAALGLDKWRERAGPWGAQRWRWGCVGVCFSVPLGQVLGYREPGLSKGWLVFGGRCPG